jgi:NADH dehydrogenase FAD-containing subunit
MPLSHDQAVQIYTAGTVPLPPNYPEVANLSASLDDLAGEVLCIEHRVSQAQVNRYFVKISDIPAVLETEGAKLDAKTDVWHLGNRAHEFLKKLAEQNGANRDVVMNKENGHTHGIVFVPESVGAIMQMDRAVTVGELSEIRLGGGCC